MVQRPTLSVALLLLLLAPTSASGQLAERPNAAAAGGVGSQVVTILTQPEGTRLRLTSSAASAHGPAPLDLPSTYEGRFSLEAEGPSVARTQGLIYVPKRTDAVVLLSEPRGMSMGLFVRSLNFPGFPNLTSKRTERGLVLSLAGAGGLLAAGRAHMKYRDRLKEFGGYSSDRARDERLARNGWVRFAAATWGVSALDYWVRPRFEVVESVPGRVTLSVPSLSRGGVVLRSALVPGAGQEFANHRFRGTLWLGAALAAGAGIVVADGMVERDQTRADWAEVLVDSAGPSELASRLRDRERSRSDLQSSEDLRRGFRYALIGVYVANVVDAMLIAIRPPATRPEPRLSASVPIGPDGAAIQATFRF